MFEDFIAVLKMDSQPLEAVHRDFYNGGERWEAMENEKF